jgi:hypothetical protein
MRAGRGPPDGPIVIEEQAARPECRRAPGTSMKMTKGVSHMMPMMSWMSFTAWFTLLVVLLFVAGLGALIAVLVTRHSGPPTEPHGRS